MNNVVLIGRLTEAPDVSILSANKTVLNFTIAVRRRFHAEGDADADFIRCTAWDNNALFIEKYFQKGDSIGIVGELRNNKYTDEHGEIKYATCVNVTQACFPGSSLKR